MAGSCKQLGARRDQPIGRYVERVGGQHEIGLVPGKIVEHRGERAPVGQLLAQDLGREAGKREQSVRAILVGQDPAERRKRQRVGIAGVMGGVGGDCQLPR